MQPHRDLRPVPPGIAVERDADAVFDAAIAAGVLSAEQADRNWAGHCFYMFHDGEANVAPGGAVRFRHRVGRTHVTMTARRAGNAA